MGEEITPQNSIIESDHSRSSEVALIEKFFPEIKNFDAPSNRERKYSRKYNVVEDHIEEQNFKWIPEQTEYPIEGKKKHKSDRKSSHKHVDQTMSTLESDKTSSSCTVSDFTSNVCSKNGYIRGTNDKKCGHESNLLKYNEFSSLMSSLGNGRNFPVEVKLDDKNARKEEERKAWVDEENSIFLILGGIQMMLGILMAVFGVLVIAHDSSLSGSGSGLWGGAVAMFSGLVTVLMTESRFLKRIVYWLMKAQKMRFLRGELPATITDEDYQTITIFCLMGILAGLKGCYSAEKSTAKVSRTLLTIFLALCLVSFALSNLVVVLTATGLIRDVQRPKNQGENNPNEEPFMNWPPVLADVGLILASALQCVAAVCSGYKCYKRVCPCLRSDHNRLSDADSHSEKYKVEGKEKLVHHWLGQQLRTPTKKGKNEGQNNMMPWGTPNIVLLPPPPPMISNGQIPILTFLQAPSSVFGSSACGHMYSGSMPCCCHHENRYMTTPHPMVHERKLSRKITYIQPDSKVPGRNRSRSKSKRERRASLPTAEEVARTYTGLDREIAEEFIAIAMDKGARRSRNNSFAECGRDSTRTGY